MDDLKLCVGRACERIRDTSHCDLLPHKFRPGYFALIDNTLEGAARNFRVVWHRNGDAPALKLTPHDDVTATLSYLNKAVVFENPANLARREDAQLRHGPVPVS